MEYNYHANSLSQSTSYIGKDYCLIGNGYIQAIIQLLDDSRIGNAIGLNLMCTDNYRKKELWLNAHHSEGVNPTTVAFGIKGGNDLYYPCSTQIIKNELVYKLSFDDGIPTVVIEYPLKTKIPKETCQVSETGVSPISAFFMTADSDDDLPENSDDFYNCKVVEKIWAPVNHPIIIREVFLQVPLENDDDIRVFHKSSANKLFTPDGYYDPKLDIAVFLYSGRERGDVFAIGGFSKSVYQHTGEFPEALQDMFGNGLKQTSDEKTVEFKACSNPFWGVESVLGFDPEINDDSDINTTELFYAYGKSVGELEKTVETAKELGLEKLKEDTRAYYSRDNSIQTQKDGYWLKDLFEASKSGIRSSVSSYEYPGRMNSGIWHYDGEWSRDSDLVALGALYAGQFTIAKEQLYYCLEHLTTPDGRCVAGPGGFEGSDKEAQVDMCGIRLYVLEEYLNFTGDNRVIDQYWDKIKALAEAPLDKRYWSDDANMTKRTRDCWERSEPFGIKLGFELWHQMWLTAGLKSASVFAQMQGLPDLSRKWLDLSQKIWKSVLEHPKFALIENDHFIKRKTESGEHQKNAVGFRGFEVGKLEPDATEVFPIVLNMVDPENALSKNTLNHVLKLKNQDGLWDYGGLSRYNVTSMPDYGGFGHPDEWGRIGAPHSGPWPLANAWFARAAFEAREYDKALDAIKWIHSVGAPTFCWFEHMDYAAKDRTYASWYSSGIVPWCCFGEIPVLIIKHILGYRPGLSGVQLVPHIPEELSNMKAVLRYRAYRLTISYKGFGEIESVEVNGEDWKKFDAKVIQLPLIEMDLDIVIRLIQKS